MTDVDLKNTGSTHRGELSDDGDSPPALAVTVHACPG